MSSTPGVPVTPGLTPEGAPDMQGILAPSLPSATFLLTAGAVALVGLRLVTYSAQRGDIATASLVGALSALAIWLSLREDAAVKRASQAPSKTIVAMAALHDSANCPLTLEGPLYSLRPLAPMLQLKHLPLQLEVAETLIPLRQFMRRDKGKVWRVISALEDFYARYYNALLLDPKHSATSARVVDALSILHDTRADALNTLSTLGWTRPGAGGDPRVNRALEAVRVSTLRCMGTLASRNAGSPELSAAEGSWRPPYPNDALGRPPQVVHL